MPPQAGPITLLVPSEGGLSNTAKPMLILHFATPLEGRVSIGIRPVEGLARGFATSLDGRLRERFHAPDL
jgi:hypothetical protein